MTDQGTISISAEQADFLFGKLGTHSRCAGATLWLRDQFFADRFGRKVAVTAESRRTASGAVRAVLFQLSHDAGRKTGLQDSKWCYLDRKVG
jgi:hypothetical protein